MASVTSKPGRRDPLSRHRAATAPAARSLALTTSSAVLILAAVIGLLALVAALAGLLWPGGEGAWTTTTHRGLEVELYGRGIYEHDSLFAGAGNRGTDAVTLLFGIPLLAIGAALYRRGSLRGGLLLLGAETWFLYTYASYALAAAAFNDLFLVYVALFAASLWGFVLTFRSFDASALRRHVAGQGPRRRLAFFLFASAVITFGIWLIDPLAALITGDAPESLRTWNTLFTNALDIAVIVPAVALAGWLVLRRVPLGMLAAFPLLVFEALLAPMIVAQTVSQLEAGIEFSTGEIVGPISGFVILATIAIWFVVAILRDVADTALPSEPG